MARELVINIWCDEHLAMPNPAYMEATELPAIQIGRDKPKVLALCAECTERLYTPLFQALLAHGQDPAVPAARGMGHTNGNIRKRVSPNGVVRFEARWKEEDGRDQQRSFRTMQAANKFQQERRAKMPKGRIRDEGDADCELLCPDCDKCLKAQSLREHLRNQHGKTIHDYGDIKMADGSVYTKPKQRKVKS